jgi:hypothetical protein
MGARVVTSLGFVGAIALCGLAVGVVGAGVVGCATGPGAAVRSAPPAPLPEIRSLAPATGMVWVPGYWHDDGADYQWVPGHWEAPPPPPR